MDYLQNQWGSSPLPLWGSADKLTFLGLLSQNLVFCASMRQPFLLVPLLLLLGCSGKTEVVGHHPNGLIERKGYFDDEGFRTGKWTIWNDKGGKSEEGPYKNGKREGVWTRWHENDWKWAEGPYKNGNRKGVWTYWGSNGERLTPKTY